MNKAIRESEARTARTVEYWAATADEHKATQAIIAAARTLLASLEWEEKRSGTTYNGYETLRALIA